MENIIAQPLYLSAFQTNREQLKLYFPYRSEKHPIIPTEIYNTIVNKKQRIDILMKSHLSVILAKKLVGNVRLYPRFPRFHVQKILTRLHYFQDIKCVATLAWHRDSVLSVAFHPTAPLLATGSRDNTVKLWRFSADGSAATCVATLAGHSDHVLSVAFHPTVPLLATGSLDHTAKLWRFSADGSAATCVATLTGHSSDVYSVAFHPTAPLLATGSDDNTAKLWRFSPDGSASDMTCVATLEGHSLYVASIAFHPTAPLLATGSYDNTVKLWS